MENLKYLRSPLRTAVTKAADRINELLLSSTPNSETLASSIAQLAEKFDRLNNVDNKILELLLHDTNTKESDYTSEFESIEIYRDRYYETKVKAERLLKRLDSKLTETKSDAIDTVTKRKFKLPKIELKKFNGQPIEFLGFWSQFKKIHDDSDLDPEDKFQYLIQATEAGTPARDLVESFPATAENYAKAVEYLKGRFGREDILVEVYVRELLCLVLNNAVNAHRKESLFKLYDKIETHLRALETLGVTTNTYASMLYPLVEACLPIDLLRTWERTYTSINSKLEENESTNKLELLMKFLRNEVEGEERISMVRSGFGFEVQSKMKGAIKSQRFHRTNLATASGLFCSTKENSKPKTCVFCSKGHESQDCKSIMKWTLDEKKKFLLQRGCCYTCLKTGHISRNCRMKINCSRCRGRHFVILCPETKLLEYTTEPTENENKNGMQDKDQALANCTCTGEIFLMTLNVQMRGEEGIKMARAIIDTGSQRSYIKRSTAESMKYKCLGQEKMTHALFGGTESSVNHRRYRIYLSSLQYDYHCNFEALDQDRICADIPRMENGSWKQELRDRGIQICVESSKENEMSSEIQILIGADIAGKLFTGKILTLKCGLIAIETRLGWTVMGKMTPSQPVRDTSMLVLSLHISDAKITDLWNLDTLGILDPAEKKNKEDLKEATRMHFMETVKRHSNGRYEVSLPWIEGHSTLPTNRTLAEKRMKTTVKSLKSNGKLEAYETVLKGWLTEGIIEELPNPKDDIPCHYVPHRPVFKENSTTKIRPVFDGSAKEPNHPSINDCLERGPNLVEIIPAIINRFRIGKIGLIADIRKAFLQIAVNEKDSNFLRFLWCEKGNLDQPKVFCHRRVVFGITSSPFLLGAVLAFHLNNVPLHLKNAAKRLSESMYVDNCVTSVDSEEELVMFISQAREIMTMAMFDLRGWRYNSVTQNSTDLQISEEKAENDIESVLGLKWNFSKDTLSCDMKNFINQSDGCITKRKILSIAHRIFDPIGLSCPVTLKPKLILQKCWQLKLAWDSELPNDIKEEFQMWSKELPLLESLEIPRRICEFTSWPDDVTLHVFCDASKAAFATCIFLRMEGNQQNVQCQLIQARSRVSPLKKVSIPRLELLACCIGARLSNSVKEDLRMEHVTTYYWTDSADALWWIKKNDSWGTFVMNRAEEIRTTTNIDDWNFVPGKLNPADLPSRGCSPRTLVASRWWEGPEWLYMPRENWPKQDGLPDEQIINAERKKTIVSTMNAEFKTNELYDRISSYTKMVRVIGWIQRFFKNTRIDQNSRSKGNLTNEELKEAELKLLKIVQQESFTGEMDRSIRVLKPFVDQYGLIRVKTKLFLREDDANFRCPILLPSNHDVVRKLIECKHKELCHAGVQTLMNHLRENYWIAKSRKTIRQVIRSCVTCRRYMEQRPEVETAVLPEDRVKDAAAFEISGVDLAGPLFLKGGQKSWIVLFTCAIYRAVHLELVTSLSTEQFLLALRRFISRRGRPRVIYSDNGSNLVGANKCLKSIDWKRIQEKSTVKGIVWKFIPPSAPWWGGWWERLIGLLKTILRKVLGRACLRYEELYTIICDCECLINSRPLTYMSEDVEDLITLTPAMFIRDIQEAGVLDIDSVDQSSLNKRHVYRQKILEDLRKRFRSEYLGQLRQSSKAIKNSCRISIGDIVLVGSDNCKRYDWPLGRVVAVYPGKDEVIRVAKIKTKTGEYLRPVQRLYPLEVTRKEDILLRDKVNSLLPEATLVQPEIQQQRLDTPDEVRLSTRTRCGRRVAVIGAGAAGLCAGRHLISDPESFEFDVFEQQNDVGGTWRYSAQVGFDEYGLPVHSSMYKNLRTNLPKEAMAFPDFPFKDCGGASFIHHTDVLSYLEDYSKNFGIYEYIKFCHFVESVKPEERSDGKTAWIVSVRDLETNDRVTKIYDAVMVCNGHYSVPYVPEISDFNSFEGILMHSHDYRDPEKFKNLKVVVLGAGASGIDIAIEVSAVAKEVVLSHNTPSKTCPLPENMIQEKGIECVQNSSVTFIDGKKYYCDAIIICTGYLYTYPFLHPSCKVEIGDQKVSPLYMHLFLINNPTLAIWAVPKLILPFPIYDQQVKVFLRFLKGLIELPSEEVMQQDAEDDFRCRIKLGFKPRHAHVMPGEFQWDYDDKLSKLGNIAPIPDSVRNLFKHVHFLRTQDVIHYKNKNFNLLDEKSFEQIN